MSEEVREMFKNISSSYDRLNNILSLGLHKSWRRKTVKYSSASKGMNILDCASGTGDLAFEFKKVVGAKGIVYATDFCIDMLELIPSKKEFNTLQLNIETADAMNLQFENNQFDIASIAFGIRNVDDPKLALFEMARVVKPNGKVVVLEFGNPNKWLKPFYYLYSKLIIPLIGKLVSKNRFAYEYLPETISKFPYANNFCNIMEATDSFRNIQYKSLTGGIVYYYEGIVKD